MTKEHLGTKYKEYQDLFKYLGRKCNFHENKKGKTEWTCFGDLRFTEKFCSRHKLNFERVKHILQFFGGHCDCEVLMNVDIEEHDDIWKHRGLMILEQLK